MGALLGGAEGTMVLMAAYKAKQMKCSREPEYTIPLPRWLLITLVIALVSGAIMEFANIVRGVIG